MGIAEWILVGIAALYGLNLVVLRFLCSVLRLADRRKAAAKGKESADSATEAGETTRPPVRRKGVKAKLKNASRTLIFNYGYGWVRYCTLRMGRIPSHRVRNWLYRHVLLMNSTKRTVIYGGCEIRSPWNIRADRCVVAVGCLLDGRNGITIGDNVVFGGGVRVWTEEHSVNSPAFACLPENRRPVAIGDRAWICSDSTLLPGVTVGEGAVVASRACLTRDAEPFGVYAGIPARKIKTRNDQLTYELNGKPHWHFY